MLHLSQWRRFLFIALPLVCERVSYCADKQSFVCFADVRGIASEASEFMYDV